MTGQASIVSIEAFKASESRRYFLDDLARKGGTATSDDVILTATNIYQDELGFWFEDEGWDDLWSSAYSAYLKHHEMAESRPDLVDKILADLRGPFSA